MKHREQFKELKDIQNALYYFTENKYMIKKALSVLAQEKTIGVAFIRDFFDCADNIVDAIDDFFYILSERQ